MDATISTATVKFRMDVNFGDPITPAPGWLTLPPLRPAMEGVRVLAWMRLPQQRGDSKSNSHGDNLSRTWAPGRAQRRSDVSGQGSLRA